MHRENKPVFSALCQQAKCCGCLFSWVREFVSLKRLSLVLYSTAPIPQRTGFLGHFFPGTRSSNRGNGSCAGGQSDIPKRNTGRIFARINAVSRICLSVRLARQSSTTCHETGRASSCDPRRKQRKALIRTMALRYVEQGLHFVFPLNGNVLR